MPRWQVDIGLYADDGTPLWGFSRSEMIVGPDHADPEADAKVQDRYIEAGEKILDAVDAGKDSMVDQIAETTRQIRAHRARQEGNQP